MNEISRRVPWTAGLLITVVVLLVRPQELTLVKKAKNEWRQLSSIQIYGILYYWAPQYHHLFYFKL